jgi:hypothetical protein
MCRKDRGPELYHFVSYIREEAMTLGDWQVLCDTLLEGVNSSLQKYEVTLLEINTIPLEEPEDIITAPNHLVFYHDEYGVLRYEMPMLPTTVFYYFGQKMMKNHGILLDLLKFRATLAELDTRLVRLQTRAVVFQRVWNYIKMLNIALEIALKSIPADRERYFFD